MSAIDPAVETAICVALEPRMHKISTGRKGLKSGHTDKSVAKVVSEQLLRVVTQSTVRTVRNRHHGTRHDRHDLKKENRARVTPPGIAQEPEPAAAAAPPAGPPVWPNVMLDAVASEMGYVLAFLDDLDPEWRRFGRAKRKAAGIE